MLYDVNCHQGAHSGQHPPLIEIFKSVVLTTPEFVMTVSGFNKWSSSPVSHFFWQRLKVLFKLRQCHNKNLSQPGGRLVKKSSFQLQMWSRQPACHLVVTVWKWTWRSIDGSIFTWTKLKKSSLHITSVHSWNQWYVLHMLLLFVCAVYAGICVGQWSCYFMFTYWFLHGM